MPKAYQNNFRPMVLRYRNFASFYLNCCQLIPKGLYNTLHLIVHISITFITPLIASLLCHSLIVFMFAKKSYLKNYISLLISIKNSKVYPNGKYLAWRCQYITHYESKEKVFLIKPNYTKYINDIELYLF